MSNFACPKRFITKINTIVKTIFVFLLLFKHIYTFYKFCCMILNPLIIIGICAYLFVVTL